MARYTRRQMIVTGLGGGLLVAGCTSSTEQTRSAAAPMVLVSTEVPAPSSPPSATPSPPTPTVLPPTPTVAPATATPVPQPTATKVPDIGTRMNPVPMNKGYVFDKGGHVLVIGVADVVRNASARVLKANMFNQKPSADQEYILVIMALVYEDGPQDKPFRTDTGNHRFYADNRLWGAPVMSVAPDPPFAGQDIFPGAKMAGWLPGKLIPKTAMDDAILVYDDVYFALK